jgi:alpha-beta hydrolase superfamily lysophospholipase
VPSGKVRHYWQAWIFAKALGPVKSRLFHWAPIPSPTFPADVSALLDEIGRREANSKLFALGHSMGGIFITYAAAEDAKRAAPRLSGIIAMNPWIKNVTNLSLGNTFSVLFGGMRGSSRHVIYPYDVSTMTKNLEAQRPDRENQAKRP